MRGLKAPQDTWPRQDEGLHQAGSLVQAAQDGVVDHGKTAAVAKPSNSSGVKRRMHIPGNASGMQRVGVSDQTVRAGPEKERKRVADKLDRNRLNAPQPTKSAPTGSGQAVLPHCREFLPALNPTAVRVQKETGCCPVLVDKHRVQRKCKPRGGRALLPK